MITKACAKINLTLDVFGLREDGYHEIHSVMQQIDLCDIIDVIEEEREIQVLCSQIIPSKSLLRQG